MERSLQNVLRRALRRRPVRRSQIYEMFLRRWVEHEASKHASRFTAEQVVREGMAYAESLAHKMVEERASKVVVEQTSAL